IEPRLAALCAVQRLLEMAAGGLDRALDRRLTLRLFALPGRLPRHFEPGLMLQLLDRFGETQIRLLHGEADDIAMHAAAETVIEALVLDDAEGRRLFVVERTERHILAAALDETDMAADHFGERHSRAHLVEEPWRKSHERSAVGRQRWRC